MFCSYFSSSVFYFICKKVIVVKTIFHNCLDWINNNQIYNYFYFTLVCKQSGTLKGDACCALMRVAYAGVSVLCASVPTSLYFHKTLLPSGLLDTSTQMRVLLRGTWWRKRPAKTSIQGGDCVWALCAFSSPPHYNSYCSICVFCDRELSLCVVNSGQFELPTTVCKV